MNIEYKGEQEGAGAVMVESGMASNGSVTSSYRTGGLTSDRMKPIVGHSFIHSCINSPTYSVAQSNH